MQRILVTGAAGFVGFHTAKLLTSLGFEVTGLDNMNSYYDPGLKRGRLKEAGIDIMQIEEGRWCQSDSMSGYSFIRMDLTDKTALQALFSKGQFDYVLHLAAQAGVRYSITHPDDYISSNLTGFFNILECCRKWPVRHMLYASSSSVYGNRTEVPFSEQARTDQPVSLYAATKKANELMAYTYSHLYKIPLTGLRFFTVYGAWGRPDMAYYSFTEKITRREPIFVFNHGDLQRDFTYIDDIADAIARLIPRPPVAGDPSLDFPENPFFRVLNIGHSDPVNLKDFIHELETQIGMPAEKVNQPMQPGDVLKTYADVSKIESIIGPMKKTALGTGLRHFMEWYRSYHTQ